MRENYLLLWLDHKTFIFIILIVPETEVVKVMLAIAAGEMSEEKLVAWLLKNSYLNRAR